MTLDIVTFLVIITLLTAIYADEMIVMAFCSALLCVTLIGLEDSE